MDPFGSERASHSAAGLASRSGSVKNPLPGCQTRSGPAEQTGGFPLTLPASQLPVDKWHAAIHGRPTLAEAGLASLRTSADIQLRKGADTRVRNGADTFTAFLLTFRLRMTVVPAGRDRQGATVGLVEDGLSDRRPP